MGCVNSKKATTTTLTTTIAKPKTPPHVIIQSHLDWTLKSISGSFRQIGNTGTLEKIEEKEEPEKDHDQETAVLVPQNEDSRHLSKPSLSSRWTSSFSITYGGRFAQAENVAAGWPPWLCDVAAETVMGWAPLKFDKFQKLEKIGQGTYSSVYRARDVETGKIVALKKVRFNNFRPDSVRFMAREIIILRRLDHPNIMKLEGIIASKFSCIIYLVFEYMDHDLAGLLSCPDIKFTEEQIKCFMRQLLCGIEHCHSQGVMHRDVKTANILVNNEGILKIADFGLANFTVTNNREPLTSRVVTLWYRPPELILGSTDYGEFVDLWSVGCVFAELFTGKPLLKGKTEGEQLHKIFKLCGTPPDEYWKRFKHPLPAMFKPRHHYECMLAQRCNEFPKTAVSLIESFLSYEPHMRGTASSALNSEYFSSIPYACDPSSLPKYPPNKEINAKLREDARRTKSYRMLITSGALRNQGRVRRPLLESTTWERKQEVEAYIYAVPRINGGCARPKGDRDSLKSSIDVVSEASQVGPVTEMSQVSSTHSVPFPAASSGFASERRRKQGSAPSRLDTKRTLKNQTASVLDPTSVLHAENNFSSNSQDSNINSRRVETTSRRSEENLKLVKPRERIRPHRYNSFNWSDFDSPEN
ncbi:putative serine/threonine-protein kinase [Heracleum sosnowskyi]|uniref:Serine/threonine-protein kinase n=1 Tax=Heracleum sosnowskyi TaxID=360622 RepID=A0AAD8LWA1_9APIA|nr:putative serine/threonine-protein kinase [Heracleum sosnowskyi]